MKPSARRIERLLAKVEAELARAVHVRAGTAFILARKLRQKLSREEWEKEYCVETAGAGEREKK
jgi:hypothetical protein